MKISRRTFLEFLSSAPIFATSYPVFADTPIDEVIEVSPVEVHLDSHRFATTCRCITGPARIFDWAVSPAIGGNDRSGVLCVNAAGRSINKFGMHERGGYRWVSVPGGEIEVLAGQTFSIEGMDHLPAVIYFERPDTDGQYPYPVFSNLDLGLGYEDFKL